MLCALGCRQLHSDKALIRVNSCLSRLARRKISSWETDLVNCTIIYASNSTAAQGFVEAYQALSSVGWISPTAAILATTLGLRLITVPLFVNSEKLASKRIIVNNVIQRQICEKVGAHYGLKPVVDDQTGQWTLQTMDKRIKAKYNDLVDKTLREYTKENKLQLHRIVCLKICTMGLWVHASMGLRKHISADTISQQIPGFLWLDSMAEADPFMIFPLCFGVFSLLNIWANKWMFISPNDSNRWITRCIDVITIIGTLAGVRILIDLPAMQSLYWCTVLSTALCQTLLLRHPTIKKWLGIGRLPTDTTTPFRDLLRFRRKHLPIRM